MPAPACNAMYFPYLKMCRIIIAVLQLASKPIKPIQPACNRELLASYSYNQLHGFNLAAPLKVPCGNVSANRSKGFACSRTLPVTSLTNELHANNNAPA